MNFSLKDLDLRSIIRDVIRNLWVIILAAVSAFLAVTGVYGLTYKPEYTSTATLAITVKGNNGGSYSSLYLTTEMAEIFGEVFQSTALRKKIADSMGVDFFEGDISVSLIEETNLMVLSVVSETPRDSYKIITSALENYDTVSDYLFSNANLNVLQEPTVPFNPSNPMESSSVAKYAAVGAAALSLIAIGFFSVSRPTLKNSKNAKKQLDGKIIGTIPNVKKYRTTEQFKNSLLRKKDEKKSVLITSFTVGLPFVESVKRISSVLERYMRYREKKVLVVTSVEENEGKSSVAANLSLAFAEKGYRVLLIDADLKKPAMYKIFSSKNNKGYSLSNCIEAKRTLGEIIENESDNLDCLYQYEGVHDSGKYLSSTAFAKLVNYCRSKYDYIILDTPPVGVSADAEILLGIGDSCVVVAREDWAEIGMINDVADNVKSSGCDFAGFVLNAFKSEAVSSSFSYGYGYYNRYYKEDGGEKL